MFPDRHETAFPVGVVEMSPLGLRKITGGTLKLRSKVRKRRRDLGVHLETMLCGHFEVVSFIRCGLHQGPWNGRSTACGLQL